MAVHVAKKQENGPAAYEGKSVYVPSRGDSLGDFSRATKILGGKGANLAQMIANGYPVPHVAIVETPECVNYMRSGRSAKSRRINPELERDVFEGIRILEQRKNANFFDMEKNDGDIMLLSMRSGAEKSMPGMMETVLNIGLNNDRVDLLIARNPDEERFMLDNYRRLIQYYGEVALGVELKKFERVLAKARENEHAEHDFQLSVNALRGVVWEYERILKGESAKLPTDSSEQVMNVLEAIFMSAYGRNAMAYKRQNDLPLDMPTAVNIQAMVFGNRSKDSGSGVLFTRDTATGEKELILEYLGNSQGEEVVAGIRTPMHRDEFAQRYIGRMRQLSKYALASELECRDMQDMEFTYEGRKLWILQRRSGQRQGPAAFRIGSEQFDEGLISKEMVLLRITQDHMMHLLLAQLDKKWAAKMQDSAKGIGAVSGAGCGQIVFSAKELLEKRKANPKGSFILVRPFTSVDDYDGMIAAGRSGGGTLTQKGGKTSHAAIVCGGNGIPAVVGCEGIIIDEKKKTITVKSTGVVFKEGDWMTIDGVTGKIYLESAQSAALGLKMAERKHLTKPRLTKEANRVLGWADRFADLTVMVNADTPEEARRARRLGAKGIGLCRTEHQWNDKKKKEMIDEVIDAIKEINESQGSKKKLAEAKKHLQKVLDEKILPTQRGDFEGILKEMDGLPVTFRLLDPPFHEFLASLIDLALKAADGRLTDKEYEQLQKAVSLHENNPMLGLRGVRLLLAYPQILETQARAIIEAAINRKKDGGDPHVKIMVPVVTYKDEFVHARKIIDRVAKQVMKEQGIEVEYKVGTMIEIPNAVEITAQLASGKKSERADFFSFGTNDLTQTFLGLSRDDTTAVIALYMRLGIIDRDPFVTLDANVARQMRRAIRFGKRANPEAEFSICGEQGGDAESIKQFLDALYDNGLSIVSCSTFRVPGARLATAQAAIERKKAKAA